MQIVSLFFYGKTTINAKQLKTNRNRTSGVLSLKIYRRIFINALGKQECRRSAGKTPT